MHAGRRAFGAVLMVVLLALGRAGIAAPVDSPTGGVNADRWRDTAPVILISFDGFRADYLDRLRPPNFERVIRAGVRAASMQPPFPSKTFPSHYCIATGLWPEHNGLVGNVFRDPVRDATYSMRDRDAVTDGSWYRGEPIWVTAERQGMVAASFFFVGSEADIEGVRPSHYRVFDSKVPGAARVDAVLDWLRMPAATRPRMISLYFEDVDGAGHDAGPDSEAVRAAVARVDGWLGRLLDGLRTVPDGDRISVVLVSDHGMAPYASADMHAVDTRAFPDVRWVEAGPYASLFVPGASADRRRTVRDAVAAQLPADVGVYLREDVPARLHYSADPRVGDLVIVPPLGTTVFPLGKVPDHGGFTHGWDPAAPAMHAIFVAEGPRLKPGSRIGTIRHVDVYPLLAELLGLAPAPVDGSLAPFAPVLLDRP